MDDRLISPAEFAKSSGLHVETVREMCRRGDIRGAVKLGPRVWRIPISALRGKPEPAKEAA